MRDWLIRWAVKLRGGWHWQSLARAANHPHTVQWQVLQRILQQNVSTTFGQDHAFSNITSIESFQAQVPVQTYESLQPYVEKQRKNQEAALTCESPVLYAQTSGTTGDPKYIPMTPSAMRDLKKQQQMVTYHFYQHCPQAFTGNALAIVSPAIEGYFDSGIPFGSASGCIHNAMPRWVREKFVVPTSVFGIEDYDVKYRVILCLALADSHITYIACANPSTLVRLMAIVNDQFDELLSCIESGGHSMTDRLDDHIRSDVVLKLKTDPARIKALKQLRNNREIQITDLWPELKLITTWTAGSCGVTLSSLRQQLPASVMVMDIGYLASELRCTMTVDRQTQSGLPLINDHFYEFIDEKQWEQGESTTVLLHQLEVGKNYYIIVTTHAGLYRYFMNDLVTVTGRYRQTPLLTFLQKGKGVTSITGEKLYEAQLLTATDQVMANNNLATIFVMGLANADAHYYQVFIETGQRASCSSHDIAGALDQRLREHNVEYDAKRASGRLQHLQLYWLRAGAFEAYKRFCLQQGQREGQFKLIALHYRDAFAFSFDPWIER